MSSKEPAHSFFISEGVFAPKDAPGTSCYQCEFDTQYYCDTLFVQYGIECPPSVRPAVVKRKAEFLAGRYVAAQAMARLGFASTTVGIDRCRSPAWPDGLIGSITHNETHAICMVAPQKAYMGIGIDLENWMSLATANGIISAIITSGEERVLKDTALSFEKALTIAFSAKESLFKALFDRVGTYFGFHAAKICCMDIENGRLSLELSRDLARGLECGAKFDGRFVMQPDAVYTWMLSQN